MNNENTLRAFIQTVWNEKNLENIPNFIAETYVIHSDHADPWEGKSLDHEAFKTRLNYSFHSFPDIHFEIQSSITDGSLVAIAWVVTGTNLGPIGDIPATNKKIKAQGMTFYHFCDGKICGHTQVYDRTTIIRQLGFIG